MVPAICDFSRVDQIELVSAKDAKHMTNRLAKEEGIMAGMSSGGACHVALKVAQSIDKGIIVFIVCDRGDRYLSSGLFG